MRFGSRIFKRLVANFAIAYCLPTSSISTVQRSMEDLVALLQEIVDRFDTSDQSYRLSLRSRAEILFCQFSYSCVVSEEVLDHFVPVVACLRGCVDNLDIDDFYQLPTRSTGGRGHPRYEVEPDQLQYLLDVGFHVPDIATVLGISQRTVWRRIQERSIDVYARYSDICDEDLDDIVSNIQSSFPNCGQRMLNGYLRSQGIEVQRQRYFVVALSCQEGPTTFPIQNFSGTLMAITN